MELGFEIPYRYFQKNSGINEKSGRAITILLLRLGILPQVKGGTKGPRIRAAGELVPGGRHDGIKGMTFA
jgi:hypothetical protein